MFKLPATVLCVLLIVYTFRLDRRVTRNLSLAVWIPTIWLMLVSSRPVSQWLGWGGNVTDITADAIESGSPIDRLVFTLLLVISIGYMAKRLDSLYNITKSNKAYIALYLFAALSLLWSDYPEVSFKRWVRAAGALAAATIILTEHEHFRAAIATIRRVSILWIPISVLFVKYYRDFGVKFGYWGGTYIVGVTNNKNSLGRLCILGVLVFTLSLLEELRQHGRSNRLRLLVFSTYIAMSLWLLMESDSATSFAVTLIGSTILLSGRFMTWSVGRLRFLVFGVVPFMTSLVLMTDAVPIVTRVLGRDPTLTGRTDLWGDLVDLRDSFLVGSGYGSFWIGDKLEFLWSQSKYWWLPTTAHNGFLEVFLDLGLVGILFLLACLYSAYLKIKKVLSVDPFQASFRISVFSIFLFYNITESATSLSSMMWFIFMVFTMDVESTSGKPVNSSVSSL